VVLVLAFWYRWPLYGAFSLLLPYYYCWLLFWWHCDCNHLIRTFTIVDYILAWRLLLWALRHCTCTPFGLIVVVLYTVLLLNVVIYYWLLYSLLFIRLVIYDPIIRYLLFEIFVIDDLIRPYTLLIGIYDWLAYDYNCCLLAITLISPPFKAWRGSYIVLLVLHWFIIVVDHIGVLEALPTFVNCITHYPWPLRTLLGLLCTHWLRIVAIYSMPVAMADCVYQYDVMALHLLYSYCYCYYFALLLFPCWRLVVVITLLLLVLCTLICSVITTFHPVCITQPDCWFTEQWPLHPIVVPYAITIDLIVGSEFRWLSFDTTMATGARRSSGKHLRVFMDTLVLRRTGLTYHPAVMFMTALLWLLVLLHIVIVISQW